MEYLFSEAHYQNAHYGCFAQAASVGVHLRTSNTQSELIAAFFDRAESQKSVQED